MVQAVSSLPQLVTSTMGPKRSAPDDETAVPPPLAMHSSHSAQMRLEHVRKCRTVPSSKNTRRAAFADCVAKNGFKYLHQVKGHRSCVNALAFSRDAGQWMASGGDDLRVLVRDLFDFDEERPGPETSSYHTTHRLFGHFSNIFSLSWSSGNKHLVSGAGDSQVLVYDVNVSDLPVSVRKPVRRSPSLAIDEHTGSISEVSTHPTSPNLVLSASEFGELFVSDLRMAGVAQSGLMAAQISAARWNPNPSDGLTFCVATVSRPDSGLALYDMRSTFRGHEGLVDDDDAVVRYASQVAYRGDSASPTRRIDITGAQFDPTGRFLAADVSLYHPILYAVGSSEPLATFSTLDVHPELDPCRTEPLLRAPGAYPGYRNSCTVKRGSFGFESQTGKLYYVSGSDDFRAYGWQVPSADVLAAQRKRMDHAAWLDTGEPGRVWFSDEHCMVRTAEVATPSFTLEGSRSIVNSALCHPTLPMVATAGIERLVRLHYAIPASLPHRSPDWDSIRPKTRERARMMNTAVVARALRCTWRSRSIRDSDEEPDDDPLREAEHVDEEPRAVASDTRNGLSPIELADEEAIALFDELLRKEESRTLFSQGDFDASSSEESEDSESEESDESEDSNENDGDDIDEGAELDDDEIDEEIELIPAVDDSSDVTTTSDESEIVDA